MPRSSSTDRATRINCAIDLLCRMGVSEAVQDLTDRYDISRRQAYRYIEVAQSCSSRLPVPEEKRVFTVKLPLGLISAVRSRARLTGRSLSDFVADALISFLSSGHRGGTEKT